MNAKIIEIPNAKKIGNKYYTNDRILSDTENYKNRAERRKELKRDRLNSKKTRMRKDQTND